MKVIMKTTTHATCNTNIDHRIAAQRCALPHILGRPITMLLLLLLPGLATAQPCTPAPTNMVAWWPGDGHAYDVINVKAAALQNGADCATGFIAQGFRFTGGTEKVRIGESTRTDLSRTNTWTIEAWVRPTNLTSSLYPTIYSEGNKIASLGLNNGTGKLESWINNNSANTFVSTLAVTNFVWTHVALVRNASSRTFYVNGVAAGTTNTTPSTTADSTGAAIGNVTIDDPTCAFPGRIDELSLYHRALSAEEILAIHSAGVAGKCYNNTPVPVFVIQPEGQTNYLGASATLTALAMGSPRPAYQWQFRATGQTSFVPLTGQTNYTLTLTSLTFANDGYYRCVASSSSSVTPSAEARLKVNICGDTPACLVAWWPGDGSGLDVTSNHNGAVWGGVTYPTGMAGKAFGFNGSDAYVAVPDSPALSPHAGSNGEMTVEAWVYVTNQPSSWTTILAKSDSTRWEYALHIDPSGVPGFYVWTPNNATNIVASGGLITPISWHHLVGVLKKEQFIRLYQNGTLMNESTNATVNSAHGVTPLYLGRRHDGYFFNGGVDEVALYNRALDTNEIAVLYASGPFGKCYGATNPAPVFVVQPADKYGYLANSVTLEGLALGTPRPQYQWYHTDSIIPGATNATLAVSNLKASDAGLYKIVAANSSGVTTSRSAMLTVRDTWTNRWDFENGWDGWSTDNYALWQIGVPTSGPGAPHSESSCAATVLGGNYPYGVSSRLVSPVMELPSAQGNEMLMLRFWQWFSYWYGYWNDNGNSGWGGNDFGEVQVQVYNTNTLQWSGWTTLLTISRYSAVWSPAQVDLTAYAGKQVRLGFNHTDVMEDPDPWYGTHHYESSGWYLDDVYVEKQTVLTLPFAQGFENGWEGCFTDSGIWQVGTGGAYAGTNCIGTVYGGNYPHETDSRIVSPAIDLPAVVAGEEVVLKFWQWFSYYFGYWNDNGNSGWGGNDYGEVQIQVYNTNTLQWSGWTTLLTVSRSSAVWVPAQADLTGYAEKRVRLGFRHNDVTEDADNWYGTHHYESSGWFLDAVSVEKRQVPVFSGSEDFEEGWDGWSSDQGLWQIGRPSGGPGAPHSKTNCAGTVLGSNYAWGSSSRLISPLINVPSVAANEEVLLKFWQWFSYWSGYWNDNGNSGWGGNDYGEVQVQVYNTNTLQWSGWTTLLTVSRYSAVWSPAQVDLTAYASKSVRIAFNHRDVTEDTDNWYGIHHYESSGWYIDDVRLEKRFVSLLPVSEGFESEWNGWYAERGVWQVGSGAAHAGASCIGTVSGGSYPWQMNSRLLSPTVDLSALAAGEELVLQFWQVFSYWYGYWNDNGNSGWGGNDYGQVQIQVYSTNTLQWSSWTNLLTVSRYSAVWAPAQVNLTAFAGKRVRLGFYHADATEDTDNWYGINHYESSGWYLDDVSIRKRSTPVLSGTEEFENGWNDWFTDQGVWEVGNPSGGPGVSHSGNKCAGTVLRSNYPMGTSGRLISPLINVPVAAPGEKLELRFWQWFSYASSDRGYVQIQTYNTGTGQWSNWTNLFPIPASGSSGGWVLASSSLTNYAGRQVRVAFYHTDSNETGSSDSVGAGWYVDDVFIKCGDLLVAPISNKVINEQTTLSFQVPTLGVGPNPCLSFSLGYGAPAGATIAPETGVFSWAPSECQGPGSYLIPICVVDYCNSDANDLTVVKVTVNEVNQSPYLLPGSGTAYVGKTNYFKPCSGDADCPPNALTYSLLAPVPPGMTIEPSTGIIRWAPTATQVGDTNAIVRLCDGGSPSYCVTNTFSIGITTNAPFTLAIARASSNSFRFTIRGGRTDLDYILQESSGVCECPCSPVWQEVTRVSPVTMPWSFTVMRTNLANEVTRLFRLKEAPRTGAIIPYLQVVPVGGGKIRVSWTPETATGWMLQRSPTLLPASWANAPTGTNNPITISATAPALFYRLVQP